MFTAVSPVGFCEATFLEVKFPPSCSSHWPADSFSFCTAGAAKGFVVQHHENRAAFIHRRLRCCVRAGDRPSLPCQDRRCSSESTFVLSHWFTADGLADFQLCSQGKNLQNPRLFSLQHCYAKNVDLILNAFHSYNTPFPINLPFKDYFFFSFKNKWK